MLVTSAIPKKWASRTTGVSCWNHNIKKSIIISYIFIVKYSISKGQDILKRDDKKKQSIVKY